MTSDVTSDKVLDALRLVIDPELGVNVVDLGLIYRAEVQDGHVRVAMTMTTPACPLGESLSEQAAATIWQNVQRVRSVSVELVWEPRWDLSMISGAARERLGWA